MTLWVKDLQYSAYTNMARYDTISQWLDMILYHKLCYPYGLFMPSTSIKTSYEMHRSAYITIFTISFSWSTVLYDTQTLH